MGSLEMGVFGIRKFLNGLGLDFPPRFVIILVAVAVVVLFVAILVWQRGRNRNRQ